MEYQAAVDQFSDVRWRLNNLYKVIDQEGHGVPFRMNWAQQSLFDEMHYQNLVLKARQLGFTTFIQLLMLDACMFNSDIRAGTIAHTREDAEAFFRDKVKWPYEQLPEALKAANPATEDSARRLSFQNNSSLRVGTSLRSGTFQYLHVSEYGKLCAKYPDKAKEVKTGAFNTVHPGQIIFVESTAEGQEGEFYDMVSKARAMEEQGKKPGQLDFKFFFYPWFKHPGYQLNASGITMPEKMSDYLAKLDLTDEQMAWYIKKEEQQGADMKREFPSTPNEAFEAAIEGAYFAQQLTNAREAGRIGRVPYEPSLKVNTFWDLGMDDSMSIWFHQRVGLENRFIDFYQNNGEGMAHYAKTLDQKPYVYGEHFGPHDLAVREIGTGKSRKETARDLGINFTVVARPDDKGDAIETMRNAFPSCAFDEKGCADGIKALAAYRKEWDDKLGVYKNKPRHDWACLSGETKVWTRYYGMRQIMDLPPTGEVKTLCGWKPYTNPHITRRDAPLVEVVFSDGYTVKCTPDHMFLTASGWRLAESLRNGTPIQSPSTRSRNILTEVCTASIRATNILHEAVECPIIDHVSPLPERADVWCLTVMSVSMFALENGAIVHNSHPSDAFQTFALGYREPVEDDDYDDRNDYDRSEVSGY